MRAIYDYFVQACRRPAPLMHSAARPVTDHDGNSVAIELDVSEGVVSGFRYRATSCVTLMALCEHLSELVASRPLAEAAQWRGERLLTLHPEIPAEKRAIAELAAKALAEAIARVR